MQKQLRVAIALLALCAFAGDGIAKIVSVNKTNGGPSGYNSVREKHETGGIFSEDTHTLTCSDPGNSSCTWDSPPIMRHVNDAFDAIANGQYTGSIYDATYNSTTTWSATDVYNATVEETEP